MESSSTGSPFSNQSTDPSSPESVNPTNLADSYTQALQAQAAALKNGFGGLSFGAGGKGMRAGSPLKEVQVKQEMGTVPPKRLSHPPSSYTQPSVFRPQTTSGASHHPAASAASSRATSVGIAESLNGSINGGAGYGGLVPQIQSRSDPPKRMIEVDMLPLSKAPLDMVKSTPQRNVLLLQGDPQIINKQRVETAIRVILDLLRAIPPTPSTPPLPPALFNFLPPDPTLTHLSLERINCFRGLRLQLGTTTKATAKKQLQAGVTPENEMVYIEAAVYMSGEGGKRVYACKRCRQREHRRRASKDASRKKPPSSGSDTSTKPNTATPILPPSLNYITGVNPDQYDPHRLDQVVEEPGFDPNRVDWRHEIVLFNSAPEVPIKDGSCVWLPFRVVCYGKCHGEKVGFRIKFTLRTRDGTVIATSTTDPIRITDDHKTDKNPKPKVDNPPISHPQPAVPRPRKGRASAASSRRQSPAPSEAESVQSVSEAGAVMQKQTPNVRSKPYERPPSHSPSVSIGNLPYDYSLNGGMTAAPRFQRQTSSGSVPLVSPLIPLPAPNQSIGDNPMGISSSIIRSSEIPNFDPLPASGTISPGALRHPHFNMTPLDQYNFPTSRPHSATSSNVASPVNGLRPLSDDVLMNGNPVNSQPHSLSNAFANLSAMSMQQQQQQQSLMLSDYLADQDMAHTLNSAMDGLFDASSQVSSYADDASAFSGFRDSASGLFSDSGVVPDTGMESFLDFSGGEDQGVAQPAFDDPMSLGSSGIPPLFDLDLANSPMASGLSPNHQMMASPSSTAPTEAQLRQMLASLESMNPIQPQPVVSHVIPAEGPLAGGIQIAIAGQRFSPGMTIMFGSRVAKTTVISDSFCTCELPPGAEPGCVEVGVQGAVRMQGQKVEQFRYQGMDKEMMRLALEVRDQYQGSSSDAAYRLAQRVANSTHSGNSSDRSSASPMNSGPSPTFLARSADTTPLSEQDDLQLAVTNFLASIDEHAPGSLRRSGAINTRNKAQQTLLHIATVMGFHRLVRRLILMGAHLDLQDVNGFTALALASLGGQVACARVLIEAGASYDRPTAFGEMPLDLAKLGEREDVEALLLSAVWSTSPGPSKSGAAVDKSETSSEIDDDNPSSGSDIEDDLSRIQPVKRRMSRKARGNMREGSSPHSSSSRRMSRTPSVVSLDITPQATPALSAVPPDSPPPYEPNEEPLAHPSQPSQRGSSWMSRTFSNISNSSSVHPPNLKLPENMWNRLPIHIPLPSLFEKTATTDTVTAAAAYGYGWIALPAPSWDTLQKMTSPEELKLFTQAMAAQALNALLQSTGTLTELGSGVGGSGHGTDQAAVPKTGAAKQARRNSGSSSPASKSRRGSTSVTEVKSEGEAEKKIAKQVKHDKMLYLFWLPILLFVGFWLVVTALPIATGLCLIYGRQITRAIRQKL